MLCRFPPQWPSSSFQQAFAVGCSEMIKWVGDYFYADHHLSHIICETRVLCKQNQHPMWDQSRVKGRAGGCRAGALSGEQTIHFADNCYTLNHSTVGTLLVVLLVIVTHTNTIQLLLLHTEPLHPGASNKRRDTKPSKPPQSRTFIKVSHVQLVDCTVFQCVASRSFAFLELQDSLSREEDIVLYEQCCSFAICFSEQGGILEVG